MLRSIVVFALLALCETVNAQTGRLLIVSPGGMGDAQQLKVLIESHYDGEVGILPSLPMDLNFEAIFLTTRGWHDEPVIDSASQIRMINYLRNGGRFYAEGGAFRTRGEAHSNLLWDFLGDSSEGYTAMVIDLTRIVGIDSEFTKGIDFPDDPHEGNGDAGGGFHIMEMRPLIWGHAGYSLPLAWAPFDREIKAVLHWPIGGGHYTEFLERVLCTHFELCILDIDDQTAEALRITFDPLQSELQLPAAGEVVLTDILGREVLTSTVEGLKFRLPPLPKGSYIVRWHSSTVRASTTISIF